MNYAYHRGGLEVLLKTTLSTRGSLSLREAKHRYFTSHTKDKLTTYSNQSKPPIRGIVLTRVEAGEECFGSGVLIKTQQTTFS